jgi:hypothetical protein
MAGRITNPSYIRTGTYFRTVRGLPDRAWLASFSFVGRHPSEQVLDCGRIHHAGFV